MSFKSRQDFYTRISWEGGVLEGLEYGFTVDDISEDDVELRAAWAALIQAFEAVEPLVEYVNELLEES